MANLREMFENCAANLGDTLEMAMIGYFDDYASVITADGGREDLVLGSCEPWLEAANKLDYKYDNGFGGTDCHAVYAWGIENIYFVHEYDGATSVNYIPRHPSSDRPRFGGAS